MRSDGSRLAADGARTFLARDIGAGWAVVDATDETQVEGWLDDLAKQTDGLDIVFNAIGPRAAVAGYATPSTRLPVDTFLLPLTLVVGSQFLTARDRRAEPRRHRTRNVLQISACGHASAASISPKGTCASEQHRVEIAH